MRLLSEATALPSRAQRKAPPLGRFSEKLTFLRGLIDHPAGVSALLPSSKPMAQAMADQIPSNEGQVLELGPGTGAITQAIIARGIPASRIVAVEHDAGFAELLNERFPGLYVLQGDALNLRSVLGTPRRSYTAVVSGLPLINFSMKTRHAVIEDALARVRPGGPFVQISYRGRPAIPESSTIQVRRAAFVWGNVPPGYVWVYRRQPIKTHAG
jgi:phosphatidylethanolamine/phosphatidyl-N-methylethanolamine N-methyltransferase